MSSRLRLTTLCALGAMSASALGFGCRSAASVLLDLPPPEPRNAGSVTPAQATRSAIAVAPDTVRPDLPIEATLDADSVLALLPRAAAGDIDWVAAVREGVIIPRRSLPDQAESAAIRFPYDFYFGAFETYLPHSSHGEWLDCTNCHPTIYRTRGHKTSMAQINAGESCGVCHTSGIAFGPDVCERCHSGMGMPADRLSPTLTTDIAFQRDTTRENARAMGSLPPSIFPHWVHRIRYACSACHPEPFAMEAGAAPVTMEQIQAGRSCGACHDGVTAFGVLECNRCHSGAENAAPG